MPLRSHDQPQANLLLSVLLNSPVKAAFLFAGMVFLLCCFIFWKHFLDESHRAKQQMQWNMVNQAAISASLIDGDLHKSFTQPEDGDSEVYLALHKRLQQLIMQSKNIVYIYSFIIQDGKLHYILDVAAPDPADPYVSPVMLVEDEEPGKMREAALARKAFAESVPTESQWGNLVSAYAPIYDSEGNYVAMLGIDVRAEDYITLTQSNLERLYVKLGVALLISLLFGGLIYLLGRNTKQKFDWKNERERFAQSLTSAVLNTPDACFLFSCHPQETGQSSEHFMLVGMNQAAENIIKIPKHELIRQTSELVLSFAEKIDLHAKFCHALKQNIALRETIDTSHDEVMPHDSYEMLIAPGESELMLILRRATDKTNNDAAHQQEQQKVEMLAEGMRYSPSGVMIVDAQKPDMPISYVNQAFCDISGYPKDEIVGKNARFMQGKDTNQPALQVLREALKKGESCHVLLRNYRKDGMMFWNDLLVSPVRNTDGLMTHFIGVIHNVTDHKNAQEMLQFVNDELRRKNAALDDALASANQAAQSKRSFLGSVSHEVRTPLNGLMGIIDLLQQTELNESQSQYLKAMQESARGLLLILNDILDFSRIESGQASLFKTWFSPTDLINRTVQEAKLSAGSKPIKIKIRMDKATPPSIHADHERLQQILENYLSNAIKFSDKGTITIGTNVISANQKERSTKLLFFVTDEGSGISGGHQSKVFDAFAELNHEEASKPQGTGLGLAICKQLASLMAGEVGFSSEEGKGSTFWFEGQFEYGTANSVRRIHQNLDADPTLLNYRGKQVLVVEDNVVNQMVIDTLMQRLGFKVTIASNGKEAIEQYRSQKFDIILMDIQLPVMNGIEATKAIRQYEQEQFKTPIPIIGITAHVLESYRQACFEAGMNEYLSKPIEKSKILSALARYVHASKSGKKKQDLQQSDQQTKESARLPMEPPKPPHNDDLSMLPALDMDQIESLKEMLKNRFNVLVERFESDTSQQLEKMLDAIEAEDAIQVTSIAHSLKSAASNIGAKRLAEMLRYIEKNASAELPQVKEFHANVFAEFNAVANELKHIASNIASEE